MRRPFAALALASAMSSVAVATEKVISLPEVGNLCPPYLPTCANTQTQAGAAVGDPCTQPCQTLGDGTRWCPTTADTSGAEGTPWGWCAKSAEEGERHAAGLDEEDDWSIAGSIIGVIVLYVFGGVAYNYKVKGVGLALPHVDFWRNVGGLVKDGVTFTRARAAGDQHQGTAGYGAIGAASSSEHAAAPEKIAPIQEAEDDYGDYADGAFVPPPRFLRISRCPRFLSSRRIRCVFAASSVRAVLCCCTDPLQLCAEACECVRLTNWQAQRRMRRQRR